MSPTCQVKQLYFWQQSCIVLRKYYSGWSAGRSGEAGNITTSAPILDWSLGLGWAWQKQGYRGVMSAWTILAITQKLEFGERKNINFWAYSWSNLVHGVKKKSHTLVKKGSGDNFGKMFDSIIGIKARQNPLEKSCLWCPYRGTVTLEEPVWLVLLAVAMIL